MKTNKYLSFREIVTISKNENINFITLTGYCVGWFPFYFSDNRTILWSEESLKVRHSRTLSV